MPYFFLFLLLMAGQGLAQSGLPDQNNNLTVGRIISTSGEVSITRADGSQGIAQRRADIHEGDSIQTGAEGFVQMRMIDSAQITLHCSSIMEIRSYLPFDSASGIQLYLNQGHLRTITGSHQGTYRLVTPVALAGPLSSGSQTVYLVLQESDSSFLYGVFQGNLSVMVGNNLFDMGAQPPLGFLRVRDDQTAEFVDSAFANSVISGACPDSQYRLALPR